MRLTLRTLLSYLDDTLDPAQTRLIGQKVAESPAAQELITRIKEVVRRRRLTTPPNTGTEAKLDPNVVAEYIDNILSPEMIAQVEEVCLEEDVYLAEIAACHQLLTVILSEPALVPPTAKKRMYALAKGREALPHRRAPAAANADRAAESRTRGGADDEDETLLLGLSSLLKPGGWFRRVAPLAAAALLAVGLVVAVWFALPPAGDRPERELVKIEIPNFDTKKPVDSKGEVKVEPKPEPRPEPKPVPKTDPKTEPKPEPKPEPEPAPAPAGRHEIGKYMPVVGTPSVLLQRRSEAGPWQRVKPDANVFTEDYLLSLPGFRSEVKTRRDVQLSLWGNLPDATRGFTMESGVILTDSPDYDLDVLVDRGRIAVLNTKPGPAKVRIRFLKETWELAMQPGSEIAMELWGAYPRGVAFSKEPGGEEPMEFVGMFLLKGQIQLKIRYDTHLMREAPGKNFYFWDNTGPAQRSPQSFPADKLPSWARKDAPKPPKEMQQALAFFDSRISDKAPLDDVFTDALKVKDPKSPLRVVAVFGLAAVNDLPRLVDALGNSEFRDVRLAAISAMRHWSALKPDSDIKLYKAIEAKYRAGPAEIVMTLLHTFGDREQGDPLTYEALIAYLKHDKVAIRELAYSHLAALVPDAKINYDPAGPPDHRDVVVQKWKEIIPDGKLPPPPKVPRPPVPKLN